MKTKNFAIKGMTCQHCVKTINREVGALPGVLSVEAEVGKAEIKFDEKKTDEKKIKAAIIEAGYQV